MDINQALLVANVATYPTAALMELERVLPGDIKTCQMAGEYKLSADLLNTLDAVRQIIQARRNPQ